MAIKIKGRRMGSIRAVRNSVKKGSGQFIKGVPENGITVRFLQEPEEWFGFQEHFDETLNAFYPCVEGQCPGCEQGLKASQRYLTNAVDIGEDKVIPLKLAKSLANRLMNKYDKYSTVTDRDYELTRSGTGFDTEYDLDAEPPRRMVLTKYTLFDLEKVIEDAWKQAFENNDADDEGEDDPPRSNRVGGRPTKAVAKKAVAGKRVLSRPAATKTAAVKRAATPTKAVAKKAVGKRVVLRRPR